MAVGTDLVPFWLGINIGEGIGDLPESEISVLDDSAPGDCAVFQPKKDVILFPGVFGCFESTELPDILRFPESTRIGEGLFERGCNPIVSARL